MAAIFNYFSTYTKQTYIFKKLARNDASKSLIRHLILLIWRACPHSFVMISSLALEWQACKFGILQSVKWLKRFSF